ncbi:MAG: glutaminase A [Myxococcota bacterium]
MKKKQSSVKQPPLLEGMSAFLGQLYVRYREMNEGRVSDAIPELSGVAQDAFGIAVVDVNGHGYEIGDSQMLFTIQSVANPFVYGMALEDLGSAHVERFVGLEPTGQAFNSIRLEHKTQRAHNPMVNAGAIALSSMVQGANPAQRLKRILKMFARYTGEDMRVSMPMFLSERSTSHRNRALAHLMCHVGILEENIEETLDLYFQQCSLEVNCKMLATMGATLANLGVQPCSQERLLSPKHVKDVLSIMFTCGMYNFSGEWADAVGLPAKSGISGGMLMVVPQQFGLAVYSPRLNQDAHSVRGIRVCEDIVKHFHLHVFDLLMGHSLFGDIETEYLLQCPTRDVDAAQVLVHGATSNMSESDRPNPSKRSKSKKEKSKRS